MAQICDLTELQPGSPVALTIGIFDGVHRGHQALISHTVQRAHILGGQSVALTFYPHPRTVLQPDAPVYDLTSLNERANLIAGLGIDVVATLRFTHELSILPAEAFLDLLKRHVNLRELCVGTEFALGRQRSGTPARLAELGVEQGFTVSTVAPVQIGGARVSSSRVRALVAAGDVEQAALLLGRYTRIEGIIVAGVQRGRTLGFPTANLALTGPYLLPANGIYAVYAEVDGARLPALANIGVRPTFGHANRLVEVHILDFKRTIYGQRLGVHMVKRLRDERRFPSADALVAQMQRDVAAARTVLVGNGAV
jgi:riboflavin kinase/FMN adenylyltransferase